MNQNMLPLMARLALTNPQQLASIAAAKGLVPPPLPVAGAGGTDAMMGGAGADMMGAGPRGPVGPTGMPTHTGMAGPAGAATLPPMTQPSPAGMPPADPFAGLSQVQAPPAPQPLPPVGVPMGSGNMNVQALLQALLSGNAAPAMPPSLGQMILGG